MAELTTKNAIEDHQVVSSGEWLAARKELLRKEKEFTRQRDQLSELRRELPWVQVDKHSCSVRAGKKAAPVARFWPTTLKGAWCTSPIAT